MRPAYHTEFLGHIAIVWNSRNVPFIVTVGIDSESIGTCYLVQSVRAHDVLRGVPDAKVRRAQIHPKLLNSTVERIISFSVDPHTFHVAIGTTAKDAGRGTRGTVVILADDVTRTATPRIVTHAFPSPVTNLSWSSNTRGTLFMTICEGGAAPFYDDGTRTFGSGAIMSGVVVGQQLRYRVLNDGPDHGIPMRCATSIEERSKETNGGMDEYFACCVPKYIAYYYPTEIRVSSAFDQRHHMITSFKNYLVLVEPDVSAAAPVGLGDVDPRYEPIMAANQATIVTVIDRADQISIFRQKCTSGIIDIATDGNSLCILTADAQLHYITEIDTHRKLQDLYRHGEHGTAIRLAQSEGQSEAFVANIRRDFADSLWAGKKYQSSVDQFKKTIGHGVEPSYVIGKLLDATNVGWLAEYLKALHEADAHSPHHTRLLLNCFTKLDRGVDEVRRFLLDGERVRGTGLDPDSLDVDAIIQFCVESGGDDTDTALRVARHYQRAEWVVTILMRQGEVDEAIATMDVSKGSPWSTVCRLIRQHGPDLLATPARAEKLRHVIVGYHQKRLVTLRDPGDDDIGGGEDTLDAVYPVYLRHSGYLLDLLAEIATDDCPTSVWDTLFELRLARWTELTSEVAAMGEEGLLHPKSKELTALTQTILAPLNDPRGTAGPDLQHALTLCHVHNFPKGQLAIYRRLGRWGAVARHHLEAGDVAAAVKEVRGFIDKVSPTEARSIVAATLPHLAAPGVAPGLLDDLLRFVDERQVMTPLQLIDVLASTDSCTLGQVGGFLREKVQAIEADISASTADIAALDAQTAAVRTELERCSGVRVYKQTECEVCHGALNKQVVHFRCGHSYHLTCLLGDKACTVCSKERMALTREAEQLKAKAANHAAFFKRLQGAGADPFEVVTEYLGSSIFTNMTLKPPEVYFKE